MQNDQKQYGQVFRTSAFIEKKIKTLNRYSTQIGINSNQNYKAWPKRNKLSWLFMDLKPRQNKKGQNVCWDAPKMFVFI